MGVYAHMLIYLPVHYPSMATRQRGEELQGIIKKIRDGSFEYEGREPQKTRWTQYDQAQIHEMADYLDNVRDLVDEADRRIKARKPPAKRGPGRPPVEAADIAKVLLMQTYTGSPNRVAEGLLFLFREKLGISRHFSYKTIERGYDREAVNEVLDEITRITNESLDGREVTFSFDGTGFSGSSKENYASRREKQRSKKGKGSKGSGDGGPDDGLPASSLGGKRGFTYAVMGVGVRYKLVSGISISPDHSVGETTLFPRAFDQTLGCHPGLRDVLGDGIYGVRWLTDLVAQNHATPYFLPRSNATFKSLGYTGWAPMLQSLWKDPQGWLEAYHMRSISETVNSMLRCRFGAPLRKRLDPRREVETRLKLVAHDVRRMGYLEALEDITPHWPRKGSL